MARRRRSGAVALAVAGHVVGRTEEQADRAVAEGNEVVKRLFSGHHVVARDRREVEPGGRRVDEHDGKVAFGQLGVVAVRGVLLGVQAAGEDDARHLLVEEQVDVGRLGEAADGARAQHRGEALLGEGAADDVGDGREDRVLQFRQHEADEPGPLAAQLRRTFVAEHVEGREHRLAGRLGDAGTLVEHSADRRLAHADVAGDLGKPSAHPAILRHDPASTCKSHEPVRPATHSPFCGGLRCGFRTQTPPEIRSAGRQRASSATRKATTRASSRQAS